jgi:hypothetical protein
LYSYGGCGKKGFCYRDSGHSRVSLVGERKTGMEHWFPALSFSQTLREWGRISVEIRRLIRAIGRVKVSCGVDTGTFYIVKEDLHRKIPEDALIFLF